MATLPGARCALQEADLGSLEAGKKADIVIFDGSRPEWRPLYHPVANLVFAADGRSVETVVIDGTIVLEGGRMTTIDEDSVMRELESVGGAFCSAPAGSPASPGRLFDKRPTRVGWHTGATQHALSGDRRLCQDGLLTYDVPIAYDVFTFNKDMDCATRCGVMNDTIGHVVDGSGDLEHGHVGTFADLERAETVLGAKRARASERKPLQRSFWQELGSIAVHVAEQAARQASGV